jgi:sortase A
MTERLRTRRGLTGWIERALWAVGLVCVTWAGTTWLRAVTYQAEQQEALDRQFSAADQKPAAAAAPQRLSTGETLGRLEIPRLKLSVVVAEGDDDDTLEVAVGHLPDTPLPWQEGNAAVAAHRDTLFRPLRHIREGDEIRLDTPQGTLPYRVTRYTVVDPEDLWVLEPSAGALTLITCFPFDFVGNAPRRFVVHAERVNQIAQ